MIVLDGSELTRGAAREVIKLEDAAEGKRLGWIVEDSRRRRPRYFDGRFLTARDLIRDQQYFSTRQADLGQLSGGGVIAGLAVTLDNTSHRIRVGAGHGVTPNGEVVTLLSTIDLDINDLPRIQLLEAAFGLSNRALPPLRSQTGVFVLALRPVEYTANPIASYPTTVGGDRTLADGDVIEATALTLIPFPGEQAADSIWRVRARLARQIFLGDPLSGLPAAALPIAVVGIERGIARWIDQELVRRDAAVDGPLSSLLGQRSLREAFFRQHAAHLAAVLQEREQAGLDARISASDYFEALPPVGVLPSATVEASSGALVQWFFPAEVAVELTLAPRDELPGLVEEALALAPIDLTAGADALEATHVLIVVPVERTKFQDFAVQLDGRMNTTLARRVDRPLGRVRPIDALNALRLRRAAPSADTTPISLTPWTAALAATGQVLYVRRRQLPEVVFVIPRVRISKPDLASDLPALAKQRLDDAHETDRFNVLFGTTDPSVFDSAEQLLSAPDPDAAPQFGRISLVNGFMAELSYRARRRILLDANENPTDVAPGIEAKAALRLRPLTQADVTAVGARFTGDEMGVGMRLLLEALPTDRASVSASDLTQLDITLSDLPTNPQSAFDGFAIGQVLAQSLRVPEIDLKARQLTTTDERRRFALGLVAFAQGGDVPGIRQLVGLVVEAARLVPIDSPAWPIVSSQEVDEAAAFSIVHAASNAALKTALGELFKRAWMATPVLASGVLMELLRIGWGLDAVPTTVQVGQILDAIDAWTVGEFAVPGLTSVPPANGIRLTFEDSRIGNGLIRTYDRLTTAAPPALAKLNLSANARQRRVLGLSKLANEIAVDAQEPSAPQGLFDQYGASLNAATAANDLPKVDQARREFLEGLEGT